MWNSTLKRLIHCEDERITKNRELSTSRSQSVKTLVKCNFTLFNKGSFNNYVAKKRGGGWGKQNVHSWSPDKG